MLKNTVRKSQTEEMKEEREIEKQTETEQHLYAVYLFLLFVQALTVFKCCFLCV